MKRILSLLLVAALLLSCSACAGKKTHSADDHGDSLAAVFPSGVTVCGTDVTGMTAEEAKAAVEARAASYVLTLSLDGENLEFSAEDLSLACGTTDYEAILQACLEDSTKREITVDGLITYDASAVETALKAFAGGGETAKNAHIEMSGKDKSFVLIPEEQGGLNLDAVLNAVKEAVPQLQTEVSLDAETVYQPAEITADSPEAKTALEKANKMLDVTLTYTYAPEGAEPVTETIDRELIWFWLTIDEDGLTVEIDPGPLQEYVSSMDEAHSVSSGTSQFKTTGGSYIDIRVPSAGQTVDTDALYNDIFDCVTNGVSGDREAPYVERDADTTANFGGNYVEVDLSSQHLWVYNGGTCVVSTDIVSGCVNTGHATPTGLYTIQSRETDRYLIGPGYKSWVNYWMPFNGGIGLHDADGWRWAYGGSIYQYNGSHGCVNMPGWAAAETYNNVSVGTHVIVYGGLSSVAPVNQSISGTGSYTVNEGDGAFTLDAAPAYSTSLSYSSDNPAVATVSADGVVTVVGPGVANITVTAAAKSGYTSATMTVTVTVNSKCSQGEHTWNDGTVTTAPTCTVEGVKTFTCTICGQTRTEAVPKIDHASDSGTVTKPATCGAPGVKTYSCTSCGAVLRTEEIPATGQHTYDGGKVTKEATCTEAGQKTYTCTVCGHTKTEEIPALGHSFEGGVCKRCGAVDPNAAEPPADPKPDDSDGGAEGTSEG